MIRINPIKSFLWHTSESYHKGCSKVNGQLSLIYLIFVTFTSLRRSVLVHSVCTFRTWLYIGMDYWHSEQDKTTLNGARRHIYQRVEIGPKRILQPGCR